MKYERGSVVVFRDPNGNVVFGKESVAEGMVNGDTLDNDDGSPEYVPVWCSRDRGREQTTVYVHVSNVIEVRPATRRTVKETD